MKKIIIVLKLQDNITIPSDAQSINPTIFLGDDFYEAQHKFIALHHPSGLEPNQSGFNDFYQNGFVPFFESFQLTPPPFVCLYCLADKIAYVQNSPLEAPNFLNYFAFEYELTTGSIQAELHVLSPLIANRYVDYWWYENPVTLCDDVSRQETNECNNPNAYYDQLGCRTFSYRGEGITLIDAEDYGGIPQHAYLASLKTVDIIQENQTTASYRDHFYKTLGILFATTPVGSQPELQGLIPEASLGVMAFKPAEQVKEVVKNFIEDFKNNFKARMAIPAAMKYSQASIVLFERQATFQIINGVDESYYSFPLEIFWDMRNAMIAAWKKGILVIQPAGQQESHYRGSTNLNNAIERLKNSLRSAYSPTYTDFRKPFFDYAGSASILVGTLAKTTHIKTLSNYGPLIDVYLWGECIDSLGYSQPILPFDFTSASAALAAGIAGIMQSAALANGTLLSTFQLKTALNKTFRGGRTNTYQGIPFYATTLENLWQTCASELLISSPASR